MSENTANTPAAPCVELTPINGKEVPTTTSLKVAEFFGKNHRDVLRDIRNVMANCSESFNERNFALVEYVDPKGESRPMYAMTKDGFTMLAMGYTGEKAMRLKEAYIAQYNAMEQELLSRQLALPTNYADALRSLAAEVELREAVEREKAVVVEQRDKAIREKSWIGSKREATAMATASTAKKKVSRLEVENDGLRTQIGDATNWKTVKAQGKLLKQFFDLRMSGVYSAIGKRLKKISMNMGKGTLEVPDSQWNTVHAYHVAVWEHFFQQCETDPNFLRRYRRPAEPTASLL